MLDDESYKDLPDSGKALLCKAAQMKMVKCGPALIDESLGDSPENFGPTRWITLNISEATPHGLISVLEAIEKLNLLSYTYKTWMSTETCPSSRIIIAVDQEISVDQHRIVHDEIIDLIAEYAGLQRVFRDDIPKNIRAFHDADRDVKFDLDESDISRFFYAPEQNVMGRFIGGKPWKVKRNGIKKPHQINDVALCSEKKEEKNEQMKETTHKSDSRLSYDDKQYKKEIDFSSGFGYLNKQGVFKERIQEEKIVSLILEDIGPVCRGAGKNPAIYRYNQGVWEVWHPHDIGIYVAALCARYIKYDLLKKAKKIEGWLCKRVPRMHEKDPDVLAFRNGGLNVITNTFTPTCPENGFTSCLPIDWTPEQTKATPYFDKWLDWVAYGDSRKKTAIAAALYFVMTRRHNWHFFLELTGPGGTGKSVFTRIASLLVGGNVQGGTIKDFDNPVEAAKFVDCALITLSDITRYSGDATGMTAAIGGDSISINPKYQSPYSTSIYATVVCTNNIPIQDTERNNGLGRRRVPFSFDRIVPDHMRDERLIDKIAGELPGIVNFLINLFDEKEARHVLRAQQKSAEAQKIISDSDPVAAYFSCWDYDADGDIGIGRSPGHYGRITTADLETDRYIYHHYLDHCITSGEKPLGLNTFNKLLVRRIQDIAVRQSIAPEKIKFRNKSNTTSCRLKFMEKEETEIELPPLPPLNVPCIDVSFSYTGIAENDAVLGEKDGGKSPEGIAADVFSGSRSHIGRLAVRALQDDLVHARKDHGKATKTDDALAPGEILAAGNHELHNLSPPEKRKRQK